MPDDTKLYISTDSFTCLVCMTVNHHVPTYGEFKCSGCGLEYVYDEGHRLSITPAVAGKLRGSSEDAKRAAHLLNVIHHQPKENTSDPGSVLYVGNEYRGVDRPKENTHAE